MKDDLACPVIQKLSSVYVLAHFGFVISCCPMADSQLLLELGRQKLSVCQNNVAAFSLFPFQC